MEGKTNVITVRGEALIKKVGFKTVGDLQELEFLLGITFKKAIYPSKCHENDEPRKFMSNKEIEIQDEKEVER